jgi:hypothetical protein
MFFPSLAIRLGLSLLQAWFPQAPIAALEPFVERVVDAYNRFQHHPDQLEFELGAIKAEIKGVLATAGIVVDVIGQTGGD